MCVTHACVRVGGAVYFAVSYKRVSVFCFCLCGLLSGGMQKRVLAVAFLSSAIHCRPVLLECHTAIHQPALIDKYLLQLL